MKKILKISLISTLMCLVQSVSILSPAMGDIGDVLAMHGDKGASPSSTLWQWNQLPDLDKRKVRHVLLKQYSSPEAIYGLNSAVRPDYSERLWVLSVYKAIAGNEDWGTQSWGALKKYEQDSFCGSVYAAIIERGTVVLPQPSSSSYTQPRMEKQTITTTTRFTVNNHTRDPRGYCTTHHGWC